MNSWVYVILKRVFIFTGFIVCQLVTCVSSRYYNNRNVLLSKPSPINSGYNDLFGSRQVRARFKDVQNPVFDNSNITKTQQVLQDNKNPFSQYKNPNAQNDPRLWEFPPNHQNRLYANDLYPYHRQLITLQPLYNQRKSLNIQSNKNPYMQTLSLTHRSPNRTIKTVVDNSLNKQFSINSFGQHEVLNPPKMHDLNNFYRQRVPGAMPEIPQGRATMMQPYQNPSVNYYPNVIQARNYRYVSEGCVGLATVRQSSNILHCSSGCRIEILSIIYGTNLECPAEITGLVEASCCRWSDVSDCVTVFGRTSSVTSQIAWTCQQESKSSCAIRVDHRTMYGPPSHCSQPGYNNFRQIDYTCDCTPETTTIITAPPMDILRNVTMILGNTPSANDVTLSAIWTFVPQTVKQLLEFTGYTESVTTSTSLNYETPTSNFQEITTKREVKAKSSDTSYSDNVGVIVGTAAGAVCALLILIVCVVIICTRRRKSQKVIDNDQWSNNIPDYYSSIDERNGIKDRAQAKFDQKVDPYYSSPPYTQGHGYGNGTTKSPIIGDVIAPIATPTILQLQSQKVALKPPIDSQQITPGIESGARANLNQNYIDLPSPYSTYTAHAPKTRTALTLEPTHYSGLYQHGPHLARPSTKRNTSLYDHLNKNPQLHRFYSCKEPYSQSNKPRPQIRYSKRDSQKF